MSGEPTEIILAADPSGAMANLLGHLAEVDRAGLTDWALIGGLAVMVRLEDAHRPTRDIDTLSRQVDPEPKATLLGIAQSETSTGVLLPDGTKVDVIGVDRSSISTHCPTMTANACSSSRTGGWRRQQSSSP